MQIRRGSRISAAKARSLIIMMGKLGNHPRTLQTDAAVKRFFLEQNIDFERLVADVRGGGLVTLLENIAGPAFETLHQGSGSIRSSVVKTATGEELAGFYGDGHLTLSPSWSRYLHAESLLRDAMERGSLETLVSSIESGISAVEGFILERARDWNRDHNDDQLNDTATNKVPFDLKVDRWIPKMAAGFKLDKGGKNFQRFAKLKKLRDDFGAHLKQEAHAFSSQQFVQTIDAFRGGIAGILIDLHRGFGMRIPAAMIREFHAADAIRVTPIGARPR